MPSLKDHYSKLESVNNVSINFVIPSAIPKPATASPAPAANPTISGNSQIADSHQFAGELVAPEVSVQHTASLLDTSSQSKQELVSRGLTAVYDPTSGGLNSTSKAASRMTLSEAFDQFLRRNPAFTLVEFLTSKVPPDFPTIEARVTRQRGFLGTSYFPTYVFGEEVERGTGLKTPLMTSKKKGNNKTSNYPIHVHMENELFKKHGNSTKSNGKLGKLRANFIGSEYVLFSDGANPEATAGEEIRRELLGLRYEATKKKGPREIGAVVPLEKPKVSGKVLLDASELDDTVAHLQNRKPRWNEHIKAYVLNFSKRVNEASVKNFQLIDKDDSIVLQFGKVGKDDFSLDFKYPFSPLEAFGVALSAFDFKWCCE